jgi:hypothetical protein
MNNNKYFRFPIRRSSRQTKNKHTATEQRHKTILPKTMQQSHRQTQRMFGTPQKLLRLLRMELYTVEHEEDSDKTWSQIITEVANNNTQRTYVEIGKNKPMGFENGRRLFDALIHNTNVTYVKFFWAQYDDDDMLKEFLKDVLPVQKSIVRLTIVGSESRFNTESFKAVAHVIKQNRLQVFEWVHTHTYYLYKGGRILDKEKMDILAESIKTNTSLEKLNIAFNYTTTEALASLSKALENNHSITSIDIRGGSFTNTDALCQAIYKNTMLTHICLSRNDRMLGHMNLLKAMSFSPNILLLYLPYTKRYPVLEIITRAKYKENFKVNEYWHKAQKNWYNRTYQAAYGQLY